MNVINPVRQSESLCRSHWSLAAVALFAASTVLPGTGMAEQALVMPASAQPALLAQAGSAAPRVGQQGLNGAGMLFGRRPGENMSPSNGPANSSAPRPGHNPHRRQHRQFNRAVPYPAPQIIAPVNNQSAVQLLADRQQCHHWAVERSGFDPSHRPDGFRGASARQRDYNDVLRDCLEQSGYVVR